MDLGRETFYQRHDRKLRRICVLYTIQAAEQEIPRTKVLSPDKKGERQKTPSALRVKLEKILELIRGGKEPSGTGGRRMLRSRNYLSPYDSWGL